ncbi:tyrosine-protein phosphatase [Lacimicrobium alkaliphilum]|uniref:Protein-tyrosine-phosphatase n=1 Tax=Lacimicrobium alkaliphilum TaxID=1526571 RepID=A0ABQ1R8T7_9ALTE|nr:tyrosine-protein phosphatase [Lacimicrobium alkaliphilum]GGD60255.1 protein-tyrosine-phosphatase [Lacimicrobium alkaliphilum]
MKHNTFKLVLGALLAATLSACSQTTPSAKIVTLESTSARYLNDAYELQWQSQPANATVDILVSKTPEVANARLLANDISTSQYRWLPEQKSQRYYFFIKPQEGEAELAATRLIPLEGGRNFRDLGGYQTTDGRTVKWGKIYRSGVLEGLTDQDYQLIDSLNIGTVVDFRSNSERRSEVTEWRASDVEQINEDYEMDFDMNELGKLLKRPDLSREMMEGLMVEMYPEMLEIQKQNYAGMFDRLVEKDQGLMFHCTAGKDRTGISALLVLTALGVDKQTAIDDYLATNKYLDLHSLMPKDSSNMDPKHAAMMKMFASLPEDVLQPLMGVSQPLIEAAITKMETEHGSILAYIQQELDVSEQDIRILRAKYLD